MAALIACGFIPVLRSVRLVVDYFVTCLRASSSVVASRRRCAPFTPLRPKRRRNCHHCHHRRIDREIQRTSSPSPPPLLSFSPAKRFADIFAPVRTNDTRSLQLVNYSSDVVFSLSLLSFCCYCCCFYSNGSRHDGDWGGKLSSTSIRPANHFLLRFVCSFILLTSPQKKALTRMETWLALSLDRRS